MRPPRALPAAHFDRNERYAYFGDRTLARTEAIPPKRNESLVEPSRRGSNYPGLKPVLRQLRPSAFYFRGLVFPNGIRNFVVIKNCPMRERIFRKRFGEFPGNRIFFIRLRLPRLAERFTDASGNQYDDRSRFSGRTLRSRYLDVDII